MNAPLRLIVHVSTRCLALLAIVTSVASANVLLEVDLSVENQIIVRSTAGNSLATRTIENGDLLNGGILFWGISLEDFQAAGPDPSLNTIASAEDILGDFDFAQSPGGATPSLLFAGTISNGLSLQYRQGAHTVVQGQRAFTGTRTFLLDPEDYQVLIGNLVQRNTSKDILFHERLSPQGGDSLIGQYRVVDAPGFAGARVQMQVETVVAPGNAFASENFNAVMGSGIEFDRDTIGFRIMNGLNGQTGFRFVEPVDIDLGVDSIRLSGYGGEFTFTDVNDFNGYVFRDLDGDIAPIIDVRVDPSTNTNVTDANLLFSEDEIRLDVDGVSVDPSTEILLKVAFGQEGVLPGDYNGDSVVDAADYTVWRDTEGQTGIGLAADADGNGVVDEVDYRVWRNFFGQFDPAGATATAVPEPGTLVLLCLGEILLGRSRVDSCDRPENVAGSAK